MQTFIFDVDGTLLDTERMYMLSLQQVLDEHGQHFEYHELVKTFGITSRLALKTLRIDDSKADGILADWAKATNDFQSEVHVYDGIKTTLAAMKAAGAQLAVMTSKRAFEYDRDVKPYGLDQYFETAVFADDVEKGKPAPDAILLAMKRLNADPAQTMYVGDTIYDEQAAHAAKVSFGLVAWGNNPAPDVPGADVTFSTPAEMMSLIN